MCRTFVVVIALTLVLPGLAVAEPVAVTVVDAESGDPIEGARIRISNAEHRLGIGATTGEDGVATLEGLPVGTLRLVFSASGYVKRRYLLTADTIATPFEVRLAPDGNRKGG